MKPHLEEAWRSLRLADRDIQAFNLLQANPEIHISIICFHAQQAVEKSLKAVLFSRQIEFVRVHDLVKLAQLLSEQGLTLPVAEDQLRRSNPFAVIFRYDDLDIDIISRSDTANLVAKIRQWAGDQVRSSMKNTEADEGT